MASLGWQQLRQGSQVPGIIKIIVKPTFSSKNKKLAPRLLKVQTGSLTTDTK
jgi:hypothetical protein